MKLYRNELKIWFLAALASLTLNPAASHVCLHTRCFAAGFAWSNFRVPALPKLQLLNSFRYNALEDPDFASFIVALNPYLLNEIKDSLKVKREIILAAATSMHPDRSVILQLCDPSFLEDKEIVKTALTGADEPNTRLMPLTLQNDIEFIRDLMKVNTHALDCATASVKNALNNESLIRKQELAEKASQNAISDEDLSEINKLSDDIPFISFIVEINPYLFGYANYSSRMNRDVVLAAAKSQHPDRSVILQLCDPSFLGDEEIVMPALTRANEFSTNLMAKTLKDDEEFILNLMNINGHAFNCATDRVQKLILARGVQSSQNKESVNIIHLPIEHPAAPQPKSTNKKSDHKISEHKFIDPQLAPQGKIPQAPLIEPQKPAPSSLNIQASESVENKKNKILDEIKNDKRPFKEFLEFSHDVAFVSDVLNIRPSFLALLPDPMKINRTVVLAAASSEHPDRCMALSYCHPSLTEDEEIVKKALEDANPHHTSLMHSNLKNNEAFILNLMKINQHAFQCATIQVQDSIRKKLPNNLDR